MSLIIEPNSYTLYRMLWEFGRESSFSHKGCELLIDHFEDLNEDVVLDVVSLCRDYAESTYDEIFVDTPHSVESFGTWLVDNEGGSKDDYKVYRNEKLLEYLGKNTTVLGTFDGSVIYAVF